MSKILNMCDAIASGLLLGFAIIGVLSLIFIGAIADKPSALDVYQNKTTLEITYRDGIPVDSVVVYK